MISRRTNADPAQEELPLAGLIDHPDFAFAATLRTEQVAKLLACSPPHVCDLIWEFELTGGESGLKGFSIGNGQQTLKHKDGNLTKRNTWRVAVSDLKAFLAKKQTSHLSQ